MVRCIYKIETDVIKMGKRYITEEMGKIVLEQAKSEKLKKYLDEHFNKWFVNVQYGWVEVFIDDAELEDYSEEDLFDQNFDLHDELLTSIGIDLMGEELSWVMEDSNVELFRISKAEKLDVIAKRLKNGRYTESMFSESLLKDLEIYK